MRPWHWLHRPTQRFIHQVMKEEIANGRSSKALALYALGINPGLKEVGDSAGPRSARPHDGSDFGLCARTYNAAPRYLRKRMHPVMTEWAKWLNDRSDRLYSKGPSHLYRSQYRVAERVLLGQRWPEWPERW